MASTPAHATKAVEAEAAFIADVLGAEADALRRLADAARTILADDWRKAIDLLAACDGHVVVSGMGKSGLVGAKVSATFSSLGQPSNVLHPAEAVHGDLGRVRRGDVVILLSYSGETDEVVSLASILKADRVPRLGISSNHRSSLARLCDVHLSLGDLTEACPLNLAPTTSTTAQLAIGDALALAVARRRNFSEDDFHKAHPGGLLGVGLRPITQALRFRVGENLPVVPDTVSVGEALDQAASDRRAGAIVLVNDAGQLSGIFTDADFRRLMRQHPDGISRPIHEVMTRHPAHLTTDHLVRDAVQLVRERRLDEIPVLDQDGCPVGLVDVQDLIAMKVVQE
jgi:arabinose-5-phosphate isomerase